MAKIQDIDLPHLEFAEGSAPSTPASAIVRLYAKSDGLLYSKDDVGTETAVSGGGSSSAIDNKVIVTRTSGDLTTTSTTFTDLTGATATLTTGARRCLVTLHGVNNGGGGITSIDVAVDGTLQGGTLGLIFITAAALDIPISLRFMTAVLSAASHTIKIQWKVSSGTGKLYANTTTAPLTFRVEETTYAT